MSGSDPDTPKETDRSQPRPARLGGSGELVGDASTTSPSSEASARASRSSCRTRSRVIPSSLADRLERLLLTVEAEAELQDRAARARGASGSASRTACAAQRIVGLLDRVGRRSDRRTGRRARRRRRCRSPGSATPTPRPRRAPPRRAGARGRSPPPAPRLVGSRSSSSSRRLRARPSFIAALVDVRRHADRAGLVRDRALAGLADPPGRVGRELEALAPVELLGGAVEADDPVLDQVAQRDALDAGSASRSRRPGAGCS